MGDARRFRLLADLVHERFAAYRKSKIADVAPGKGQLQAELRRRGFRNIISFDKRKGFAGDREIYRYGYFNCRSTERFDMVVGMHPDEGTDHIVLYGRWFSVPWVVCPCCVRPSGAEYGSGANDYWRWVAHLRAIGGGPSLVDTITLPMAGRNIVLASKVISR
jgi:hypothetical protein